MLQMNYGKLIELLNEYIKENKPKTNLVKEITDDGYFVNNRNDNDGFLCETIMSKRYGFIKWLVENEKIDFKKLENLNKFNDIIYLRTAYYGLLMLLAIQDDPISFLCEILK